MNYFERKPLPALSGHLECFWFAASAAAPAGAPERVIPDGCIEWIFHLEAPFARLNQANEWAMQPRSFVVGELTRFILLQPMGPVTTTPFKMIEQGDKRVVFENAGHDFPQRIIYWISADGSLRAKIEGKLKGEPASEEWAWRRSAL